ncbi:MAG: UDP-N-acetylmuramate dehydrogenase [Oscillospiraceae bacterium]|nr:UDP-N-acetylmuramate dehydrogenase [Oscillospiraceae bacterium]
MPRLKILRNEPMKNHSSFKVGGPAEIFIEIESEEQLAEVYTLLRGMELSPIIIGKGSNILVRDEGIKGVILHMGEGFASVKIEGDTLYAQAGATMASVASAALRESLKGMEFAHGIPGSIGGGVMMNAGAYGGELKDIVYRVRYMDAEGNILETEDCRFAYRHSRFEEEESVILGAYIKLEKGEKEAIAAQMKLLSEKRMGSQPLDKPSAGSTFKRPATGYAAAMIDECGLKGLRVGDAQVSEKHAGFVVNVGNATFADVKAVMEKVQEEVFRRFGTMLEPEVRIIG